MKKTEALTALTFALKAPIVNRIIDGPGLPRRREPASRQPAGNRKKGGAGMQTAGEGAMVFPAIKRLH